VLVAVSGSRVGDAVFDGVGDDCTNERLLVGVGGAAVAE
jgi:hypothetical protein